MESPCIVQLKSESPKHANGKHYFQVNPQLPCTFISCYLITTKNSEDIKSSHATRKILARRAVWILFILGFFWIPTHSSLKQLGGSLSQSASKTCQTVIYQWKTASSHGKTGEEAKRTSSNILIFFHATLQRSLMVSWAL